MMIRNTPKLPAPKRPIYFLDENDALSACSHRARRRNGFPAQNWRRVHTPDQIRAAVNESRGRGLWIAACGRMVSQFIKVVAPASQRFGSLLVLDRLNEATCLAATDLFRHVAVANRPDSFLPTEELGEVLTADNCADLFMGGTVDNDSEVVALVRGDLSKLVVPMAIFRPSGNGTKPDFEHFSVIDHGHTLKFGVYEASADAVLYECDPKYRQHLGAMRRDSQKGFGPALRRLRKQRGLKRSDFAPLNEKTVARIERGEVKPGGIQKETLAVLAATLGVSPDSIESY
jgi:hypothetical protein